MLEDILFSLNWPRILLLIGFKVESLILLTGSTRIIPSPVKQMDIKCIRCKLGLYLSSKRKLNEAARIINKLVNLLQAVVSFSYSICGLFFLQ